MTSVTLCLHCILRKGRALVAFSCSCYTVFISKGRKLAAFSCSCYTVFISKGRKLAAFSCSCYTVVIRKCRPSVNVLSPVSHHTLIILYLKVICCLIERSHFQNSTHSAQNSTHAPYTLLRTYFNQAIVVTPA